MILSRAISLTNKTACRGAAQLSLFFVRCKTLKRQTFPFFEIPYFITTIYATLCSQISRLIKGLGINLSTGKDSPKQGQQASEGIGAIEKKI